MLNVFKKFLRDSLKGSEADRLSARRRRRSRVRSAAAEPLESRALLTASLENFLTTEHVDINLQRSGTTWSLGPKNSDADVQYANDEVVLYAGSPSVLARPAGSEFDFIGVNAGQNFYMLPASQDPELLYLGFAAYGLDSSVDRYNPATESKGRATGNGRYAKAALTDVRHTNPNGTAGSGQFSLWQSGSFGGSVVFMSSFSDGTANANGNGLDVTDGISADDAMWITAGGHSHFNFGFTQPGRYEVDLKLSAYFGDDGNNTLPNTAGFSQSEDITVYFSVMSVGQLQFETSTYSVNEGAGTASIDVVRVGGSDGRISVNYATSNGTATTGSDYTSASGTLQFLDGETRKTITVPILEDVSAEGDENFNLTLSAPTPTNLNEYIRDVEGDANGLIGTIGSAVVTIVDNDIPPTISNVVNQTTPEDVAKTGIGFTVGDDTTPAGSLTVTATSSNTTLVPNGNIVLGGSGANRTVSITPESNQFGSTTITLTVTDEIGLTATDTFTLNVTSVNDVPTISDVGNQSIDQNQATGALAFTVGDVETAVAALTVSASSSNTTLIPNGNIVIGGSGANRTVTVTPATNQSGSATITLTVTDGDGESSSDTFLVNVNSVNSAPTISNVGNQSTDEDTATGAIAFTIGDGETAAGALVVSATSSDTTLVPNANIVLGGSGANRTATITPALNQFGSTTITLTVTDAGGLIATDTFVLNVASVNDLPTISDISNQTTQAGTSVGPINFSIGDVETAATALTVSAASTNTTLLPLAGIVIAGSGINRTVTLSPAVGQTGTATVTLTVTDADGGSRSDTFDLVVTTNTLPTISDIANRFVVEGNSTGSIAFTVGDTETAVGDLVVTATSSNQAVIPNGNIVLGGSGANRTIALSSILDQVGSTTVTVTVTDTGGLQSTDTFSLTVTAGLTPFATPTEHGGTIATEAGLVVSADFTGDGKVDVITAGYSSGSLSFLQGTGDGGFLPERGLNAGSAFRSWTLSAVDFDTDGKVDLVATEFSTSTGEVVVYKNDGTGHFTRTVLATGLPQISKSRVGDLNGDGRPDIVYFKNSTTLVLQMGNAGGGLGPESVVSSSFSSATSLALADVNADGRLDIVAADSTANRIRVFIQNSLGAFELASEVVVASGVDLKQVVDMNGDGRLDLLTTDTDSASLNKAGYYAQLPSGLFGPRVNLPIYGQAVNSLRAADFNRDGVIDIAFGNLFYDEIAFSFFNFDVGWLPGQGAGAFGPSVFLKTYGSSTTELITPDLDGDLNPDFVIGGAQSAVDSETLYAFVNQNGENPMVLVPPTALTRTAGDPIDLQVYFGFPITVTGTPQIALQLGSNTVYANYIGGTGTPTLRFRYTVTATDMDLDGVQLASNLIGLNGGTMKDPLNGDAVLEFPNLTFTGVIVNGAGPLVQSITRLDSRSTVASTVQFEVTFAEPVTGVDVTDFDVAMKEGNLFGASVQSVSGSGSVYQVSVSTGLGSGTLGLNVKGTASIFDLNGDVLGKAFTGGQVYTVRRQAIGDIDNFYTHGHADYRPTLNNGEFGWILNPDAGLIPGSPFPSDEVATYLDSTSLVTRPAAATYNFLGVPAGAPLYLSNSSGSLRTTVPYMGFSGESISPGTFAAYNPGDPRMSAAPRDYMKVEMVGMRSSSGGDLSVYSVLFSGAVRLWMASSDGLSSNDNIWLRSAAHSHFNVAFSKPGVYEVDVVVSGYLDSNGNGVYDAIVDPYVESGIKTMVFHIDTLGARNDAFNVNGQETLRGSVTLNDQWDDGIGAYTASVETTTTKGTLSLQPNGSFTYQPSATFDGSDSFTYRLTNPRGGFTTATVTITGSTRPDFDAVLRAGHTDIGINFEADAWDLHIHDEETDTEYEPDEAMLYVGRNAMLTRSGDAADSAYDFLGVPAGGSLFVLPQTENPNLLFLGVGAEELADGVLAGNTATLRLASVSGPGQFSIWQSGLTPTTPQLIMATSDGIDASDAYEVTAGSHAHMNFAFTKQGFYEVTFVATGVDADGNATDSGQVTYYFNVSDGLVPFAMPVYQDPGVGPSGFQSQMADFNGDGKQDLIVAGSGANALGYREGLGNGNFMPEQVLNAGSGLSAQGIVAVDYDGDGDMDLVAQEYVQSVANTGTITLYRNNGAASFTRVLLASGHPESYRVVAGDLNADGRTDLVYGKALSTVVYALQQPNGELGAEVVLPVTFGSAQGVLLGDMDNDNDLDIVVSNRANGVNAYFSVFSNDGNGVFSAPQSKATGIFPTALQLVDMNGDGRLDVVTAESVVGSRAGYYPQLADGTFGSRVVVLPTNTQLNAIKVADLNGDGVPDIAAGAIVGGIFSMVWSPGLGGGAFGSTILIDPNQGNAFSIHIADLDGDHNPDMVTTGTRSETRPSAVRVYINKTGEDPMVLVPPAARTRVAGDPIDFSLYFGFPITVTGTPRIALDLGGNTVYANYVSGSGTPTLNFRYTVTATDLDLDGVQLASNTIQLNGGTLTDPLGGAGVLEFPNVPFNGVIVNGRGPLVQSITRLDSQATTAGTVRFSVQFAEAVTGVDLADFAIRMSAGDLAGATVTGVTGSGSLYEVTASTGTGSGTLGLSVNGTASIFDLSGDVLGKGYAGGEVYTVRPTAVGPIDTYYVQGHADYSVEYNNGDFSYYLDPDNGLLPENKYQSDEAITYLDSTAIVTRPAGANYDFLGVAANQPLYLSNSSGNIASVPFVGWGGDNLKADEFADRLTSDPRISGSTLREYVKMQMVGFRSSSGGDFSLYSVSSGNPTVWFATSDGIGSTDNIWLYRTHFHRNTAFSKPGTYEIDVVFSGYLDSNANNVLDAADVYVESGIKTMVFHVDALGAVNDAVTAYGSRPVHGNVTLNDEWHDGLGAYTVSLVTTTTKGTLTLQPNGAYSYVPSATFDGTDSFVYRLTNERGGITTGTVTITGAVLPNFEAVLTEGHADIGVALGAHDHAGGDGGDGGGAHEDPEWDLHVHDEENDIEYHPDEALLYVGMNAITTRPADAAYNFTGAAAGESLFVLPPSETPGLLFLGFGTEEIADGTLLGGSLTLRLKSASGPGHFSIWSSTLGGPNVAMATFDGITEADLLTLLENGHAHFNLGFTEMGMYQITFQAIGTLADGDVIVSEDVTYFFKVGNTAEAIDVQNGMTQRSYIRNLDVLFGSDDGLDDILANPGRVQITKFDLNGNNGSILPGAAYSLSASGDRLRFNFGLQGLGGNRNTNAGDGYYRVGIDADGDGQFETFKHFYRLLGDVNGDRKVDAADRTSVIAAMRNQNPEADVNGDGVVNSVDQTLVTRAVGRKLKDDLFADD